MTGLLVSINKGKSLPVGVAELKRTTTEVVVAKVHEEEGEAGDTFVPTKQMQLWSSVEKREPFTVKVLPGYTLDGDGAAASRDGCLMMSMPSRKLILFSMGLPREILMTLLPNAPTAGTTATIFESETQNNSSFQSLQNTTNKSTQGTRMPRIL